jgi:acyl dehydratase
MSDVTVLRFVDIKVGDTATFEVDVSVQDVDAFAALSGDHNPLHVDQVFAAKSPYGERIVHGMLAGAWFSRLVGMLLPGMYATYLSQTLTFHKPICIGDRVRIVGTVSQKVDSLKVVKLALSALQVQSGVVCVSGEGLVRVTA